MPRPRWRSGSTPSARARTSSSSSATTSTGAAAPTCSARASTPCTATSSTRTGGASTPPWATTTSRAARWRRSPATPPARPASTPSRRAVREDVQPRCRQRRAGSGAGRRGRIAGRALAGPRGPRAGVAGRPSPIAPPRSTPPTSSRRRRARPATPRAALRHSEFGFLRRGEIPLRYYTVDWPGAAAAGQETGEPQGPRAGGRLQHARRGRRSPGAGRVRERRPRAEDDAHRSPPAPVDGEPAAHRARGGLDVHADAPPALQPARLRLQAPRQVRRRPRGRARPRSRQLRSAWGAGDDERSNGPASPDFMVDRPQPLLRAHARRRRPRAIPATAPGSGVRYFLTGGGGAPLYRKVRCTRATRRAGRSIISSTCGSQTDVAFFWAIDDRGQVRDSGCLRKGETADRCIAQGTYESATLACGEPAVGGRDLPRAEALIDAPARSDLRRRRAGHGGALPAVAWPSRALSGPRCPTGRSRQRPRVVPARRRSCRRAWARRRCSPPPRASCWAPA